MKSSSAKFLGLVAVGILALLLAPWSAFAATQNAVLYGAVYDAAGNPATGVSVSLDNSAIGFTRTTVTGSDGSYNFPEVPPAENYSLSAARGATKIDSRSGITINVGDEKVVLPPLKEQPAITASAAAPTTKVVAMQAVSNETVSTAISGVITGEQLRSLPVAVNRNFLIAGLIPPNTHDVEQGSGLAGASFSIAGNRPQTNNFLLDGSDNVASSTNQAVPFQVNDSVQEFRVTSATANAEYGRNMGGTVNIVTKRAGNNFHGSTYGYFNDDSLNANSPLSVYNGTTFDKAAAYAGPLTGNTFNALPLNYNDYAFSAGLLGYCTDSISASPSSGGRCPASSILGNQYGKNTFFDPAGILATNDSKRIPFDSKQFGGSAGGALVKDKWFVFGSYEGTLVDNPNPIFERVPSTFDRTYNPYNSPILPLLFKANDPNYMMGQNVLSLFPASNVVGVPGVLEFFKGEAPNYTHVHNGLLRSDWVYSEKTDLSLRYVVQNLNQLHDDTLPQQSDYPGNGALRGALNQNLDMTYEHTFSPKWVLDLRGGFNRFSVDETPQDASFNAGTIGMPTSLMPTVLLNGLDPQYGGAQPGINGSFAGWSDFLLLSNFGVDLFPTLDGQFPFARLGAPLGAPLKRQDTTAFLAGNASWSFGKHGVKFGAEWRRLTNRLTDDSWSRGFMYSSDIGEFTHDAEACNEQCLLDPTLRTINAFQFPSFDFFQRQGQPYDARLHSHALAGYIQDTWHIYPRLTLNYGVRYEYFGPPRDTGNQLWNFDPTADGLVQEGGSSVLDPFGNPCGTKVAPLSSVPPGTGGGFRPGSGLWTCNSTSSGSYNQIVKSDTNNFAPRVGVAWDVFGSGKTVLRAGIGWFYDQTPASYLEQLTYNRPTSLSNPNALYGTLLLGVNSGFCPISGVTCGVGSTIVQPAVLGASRDGVHPNSFFSAAPQPFAIYARDSANSNTPFSRQISATVQQQITSKITMEAGYIGSHGTNLPVVYNSNFSNEANVLANGVAGNISLFPVLTMTNRGSSDYESLMARVRAADWHGLSVNGTYVWSHSIDNASDSVYPPLPVTLPDLSIGYGVFGSFNPVADCLFLHSLCTLGKNPLPLTLPVINFSPGAVTTTGAGQTLTSRYLLPQDPFNFLQNDRGNSDFDMRHRFVLDYTWAVPRFTSDTSRTRWLDNWQLSGVLTAQSGQPFSIFAGPIAGEATQRVNIVAPVQVTNNPAGAISSSSVSLASLNPLCQAQTFNFTLGQPGFISNFLQPSPNTACTGDSGRNQFVGPDYVNMNVAIQKGFAIFGEGRMLTFRTEFYNVFNRANFYNPISQLSLDGNTPYGDFGKIKSAHDPREIQFAVRFSW